MTQLRPLEDVPGIRLHLAEEAGPVWQAAAAALGVDEAPIPFWAANRRISDSRSQARITPVGARGAGFTSG